MDELIWLDDYYQEIQKQEQINYQVENFLDDESNFSCREYR